MIAHLKKGLDEKEVKKLEESFAVSDYFRLALTKLLKRRAEQDLSSGQYSEAGAGWAYQQADRIGYQRALNEVINLLKD